jgi:drug/metabolite transporter (DMT)-like permease
MSQPRPTFGVLVTLASCVLFAVMGALIRYGSSLGLDAFKTSLFRFAIGLAVLGTLAMSKRIELRFNESRLLFLRGLTGGLAIFLFFLSIDKIGMAKGTVINYSYLMFAVLGGMIFLKERVGPFKWALVVASLAGIVLIAIDRQDTGVFSVSVWDLLAVLSAVLSGSAVVAIKKLCESDTPFSIFFAQCLVGFWLVVIPANLKPVDLGWTGGAVLLLIGLTAAAGQLLMTVGYVHLTIATASVLGMLVPVINTIVGVLLFHEYLSARGYTGVAVVIVACVLLCLVRPAHRRAVSSPQGPSAPIGAPGTAS